jgi:hypothetical protein
MPSSVLLYKCVLLVPVVYIVIIFIAVNNFDEKEYDHKVKDHATRNNHDEEVKEIKEVGDNFIPDKLEFVFVRRRSEIQRNNHDY